jgi:hypothetical protein
VVDDMSVDSEVSVVISSILIICRLSLSEVLIYIYRVACVYS